jgi:alanine racemase
MQRARIDIDLAAIRWNLQNLRRKVGAHPEIMAVVKANAYGHGAVPVARTLKRAGAQQLAVATPDEALELRNSNIKGPITILGPVCDADLTEVIKAELTMTILDKESARQISKAARSLRRPVKVHVKVDTNMRRFGLDPEEVPGLLQSLQSNPFLSVYSLATHLPQAYNKETTSRQIQSFHRLRKHLQSHSLAPEFFHLANSAGSILRDARCDDIIRPGIALYGIDPRGQFEKHGMSLRPVLSVKSRLACIRNLPAGASIGYGGSFVTKRPTRLGLISIGYGDGWPYLESNRGRVLIQGQFCPILGTVMMDSLAVDLTDCQLQPRSPQIGDEVVLIGSQGSKSLRLEELAKRIGTIPYELPCRLGSRLLRNYIGTRLAESDSHRIHTIQLAPIAAEAA